VCVFKREKGKKRKGGREGERHVITHPKYFKF
jgi:hypothetical protein